MRRGRRRRAGRGDTRRSSSTPAGSGSRRAPRARALDGLDWLAGARARARRPAALRAAGRWRPGEPRPRRRGLVVPHRASTPRPPRPGEEVVLAARRHRDGRRGLPQRRAAARRATSMFAAHEVDVGALLRGRQRARDPLPRARARCWPSRRSRARAGGRALVADGSLRCFRTTLLGRTPGLRARPGRRSGRGGRSRSSGAAASSSTALRAARRASTATTACSRSSARCAPLGGAAPTAVEVERRRPVGRRRGALDARRRDGGALARRAARARRRALVAAHARRARRCTTSRCWSSPTASTARRRRPRRLPRRSRPAPSTTSTRRPRPARQRRAGLRRGARLDAARLVGARAGRAELRAALEQRRATPGMNMLRVAGTGAYESDALLRPVRRARHPRLAGLHVRQHGLPDRRRRLPRRGRGARRRSVLARARRPAEPRRALRQQRGRAAGGDARPRPGARPRRALRRAAARRWSRDAGADAPYVPSAPCGGDLPFRADRGVANYYGVGALPAPARGRAPRRGPLRRPSASRFANVPDDATSSAARRPGARRARPALEGARAARRRRRLGLRRRPRPLPRELLFGVDPAALRRADPERYLALSRVVTRRGDGARCSASGAAPRSPLRRRARAVAARPRPGRRLGRRRRTAARRRSPTTTCAARSRRSPSGRPTRASTASTSTSPTTAREPLRGAAARRALPRRRAARSTRRRADLELAAHGAAERNVEALLGRFVDASCAYRFGPPAQDLVVATLERERRRRVLVPGVPLPGRAAPPASSRPTRLGLEATALAREDGAVACACRAARLAYGVRVHAPGFAPRRRRLLGRAGRRAELVLRPRERGTAFAGGALTALNLDGRVRVRRRPTTRAA